MRKGTDEASYLIIGRKDDLLSYIQTIARDHVLFGQQLLDKGWTAAMWREHKRAAKTKRGEAT
jgi:hypothetical protein